MSRRRGYAARAALGLLVALLMGVGGLRASTPIDLFETGNSAYEAGRYEEAAAAYEKILAYGMHDARVEYNLGNAYFKLGRLGPAILHYERALRLDSTDTDTRENLELARGLIRDRVPGPEIPYPLRALAGLVASISLNEATALFLLLYFGTGGVAAVIPLTRDWARRRALGYGAVALGLCAALAGGAVYYKVRVCTADQAIVMQDRVDVRAGPAQDNTVLFTVHEGTRMEIRNRLEGWCQVSLPNALSGWVPTAAVERV
jgi:tetratricopeptide (TPR) repeat protein